MYWTGLGSVRRPRNAGSCPASQQTIHVATGHSCNLNATRLLLPFVVEQSNFGIGRVVLLLLFLGRSDNRASTQGCRSSTAGAHTIPITSCSGSSLIVFQVFFSSVRKIPNVQCSWLTMTQLLSPLVCLTGRKKKHYSAAGYSIRLVLDVRTTLTKQSVNHNSTYTRAIKFLYLDDHAHSIGSTLPVLRRKMKILY